MRTMPASVIVRKHAHRTSASTQAGRLLSHVVRISIMAPGGFLATPFPSIADVLVGTATLGQGAPPAVSRRVNHDMMEPRDSGDCGLPLKRAARRFGYRRFLHRLSDGWSASPGLRLGAGLTGRRIGDDVYGCRVEAAIAACL